MGQAVPFTKGEMSLAMRCGLSAVIGLGIGVARQEATKSDS